MGFPAGKMANTGTCLLPNSSNIFVISGGVRVQSACMASTPFAFTTSATGRVFNTAASSVLQVKHQSAVKSTNTVEPEAVASSKALRVKGCQGSAEWCLCPAPLASARLRPG